VIYRTGNLMGATAFHQRPPPPLPAAPPGTGDGLLDGPHLPALDHGHPYRVAPRLLVQLLADVGGARLGAVSEVPTEARPAVRRQPARVERAHPRGRALVAPRAARRRAGGGRRSRSLRPGAPRRSRGDA